MARGSFVFVGAVMILGGFAFTYILTQPLFNTMLTVQDQLQTFNADGHAIIGLIWQILPVVCVLGSALLYVLAESNQPE